MTQPPERERGELLGRIASEIRSSGPLPFSRFMELVLHDPTHGYYAQGGVRLGTRGDFFTASDVGTLFGECLSRQLTEMDRTLARPDPFAVVEFGAGRGLLARDVLDAIGAGDADLGSRLRYVVVDTSPAMRLEAAGRVPEAEVVRPEQVRGGHAGCVLGVELFDALPVHRVRRRGGRLRELFVGLSASGALVEVESEPLPATLELAARYGAAPEDGDEAEVCPAALLQLDAMERCLERGFLLLVDYGHPAPELYDRAHSRGTLLAYHRHAASEDYLARAGEQDLTAHVNFSALCDRARERGLAVLGLTTQDRFLISNGILECFEEADPARWSDPRRTRRRLQALQLIHPEGMGRAFRVLVLAKGFETLPSIVGLKDPFAREPSGSG